MNDRVGYFLSYWVEQQNQAGIWITPRKPFDRDLRGSFNTADEARAWAAEWRVEWERVLNGLPLPYDIASLDAIRVVRRTLTEEVVDLGMEVSHE